MSRPPQIRRSTAPLRQAQLAPSRMPAGTHLLRTRTTDGGKTVCYCACTWLGKPRDSVQRALGDGRTHITKTRKRESS